MGADSFYCNSRGSTAKEAFTDAVRGYQWEYGHGGYTGTIAEKSSFSMASEKPLSSKDAYQLANSLIDTDYKDKWGSAGCIELTSSSPSPSKTKLFLFFGWASS